MKKALLTVLAIAAVAAGVFTFSARTEATDPRDCDTNAIIYCGALTQTELKGDYAKNTTKDLPAVYSHYGVSSNMINNITAKKGVVTKSGDVIVDGVVVASGARSVGRHYISGSSTVTISGKKFYERATSVSFKSASLPALVWFDSYGKYVGSVLTSCGNPVKATPKPKPVYLCSALSVSQLGRNEFTFQTTAVVRDATFKYVTYIIRNQSGAVVKSVKATILGPTSYTSTQDGNFTVEAVVTVDVKGKLVNAPVGSCKKPFTVKAAPVYRCEDLKVAERSRTSFRFTTTATALNGATLKSITYTVKNSAGATVETITRNNLNPVDYTQNTPGAYSVTTALVFTVNGKDVTVVSADCVASFTVKQAPAYECKNFAVTELGRTSFRFKAEVAATNGATFKSITYAVKNSAGATVETINRANLDAVDYTQAIAGTYSVSTSIVFTADGQDKTVTDPKCADEFTVKPVAYECKSLVANKVDRTEFTFVTTVALQNATLKNIVYTIKNAAGNTVDTITRTNTSTVTYNQTAAGVYTVEAVVTVTVDGQDKVAPGTCRATFEVKAAPAYECKNLNAQELSRTSFRFTTTATATNGAAIKSVVYTVKNASGATVETITRDNLNPVEYNQTAAGVYTVEAVVTVTVDGQDKVAPGTCRATFTVDAAPVYECKKLNWSPVQGQKNRFAFMLSYTSTGGATFASVDVNFGDGTSDNYTANELNDIEHTYAQAGTYNITTAINFTVNGETKTVTDTDCAASITIDQEKCPVPGKENLPVDSPDCYAPCPYNPELPLDSPDCKQPPEKCEVPGKEHLPKDSPDCVPPVVVENCTVPGKEDLPKDSPNCKEDETPTELPVTGIGGLLGAFAGVSLAGSAAHYAFTRRRA